MGSKRNVKVNKCKHVFRQGQKAGKRCNKNCRKDYCKDHNKHRQEYNKNRQEIISDERRGDKDALLLQIKEAIKAKDLPNRDDIIMKSRGYEDKARALLYKVAAFKIAIGEAEISDYDGKYGLNMTFDTDIRKIDRHIKSWIEIKKKGKGKKKVRAKLTDDERKRKFERLMRKRDKLVINMKLYKDIIKAYDKKMEEFDLANEVIEDQLNEI